MTILSRLRKCKKPCPPIKNPDDGHIDKELRRAKRENTRAVQRFVEEAKRHAKDMGDTLHSIDEVLQREP